MSFQPIMQEAAESQRTFAAGQQEQVHSDMRRTRLKAQPKIAAIAVGYSGANRRYVCTGAACTRQQINAQESGFAVMPLRHVNVKFERGG